MVFSHPESYPGSRQSASQKEDQGRLGNHEFFLMMRAVRAYQERYRPKVVTLGLHLIESRILVVLNDFSGLSIEQLVVHLHAPINEAREALFSLSDRGMVSTDGDGYVLTDSGNSKAEQIWNLAQAHAKETFERFSTAEVDTFTSVLRQLISE